MYANVQYFYGFMITMNGFMNILEHLSHATQVLCTWISEILLLLPIHCFQSFVSLDIYVRPIEPFPPYYQFMYMLLHRQSYDSKQSYNFIYLPPNITFIIGSDYVYKKHFIFKEFKL